MAEDPNINADEYSYGELLGEYFTVAAEIAALEDKHGQTDLRQSEDYDRLRGRKARLQAALDEKTANHKTTEIESILDEALEG